MHLIQHDVTASYKTNMHFRCCIRPIMTKWIINKLNNSASTIWSWKLCYYSCPRLREEVYHKTCEDWVDKYKGVSEATGQNCKNISSKHKFLNCSPLICSWTENQNIFQNFVKTWQFPSQSYIYQQFEYRLSVTNPLRRTEPFLIDRSRKILKSSTAGVKFHSPPQFPPGQTRK